MNAVRIWAIEAVKKGLLEVQEYFRLCFTVVGATFSGKDASYGYVEMTLKY